MSPADGLKPDRDEHASAHLSKLAHDSEVHAVLLMDLLRLAQRLDPIAYRDLVARADRELAHDLEAPGHCGEAHRVLEQRLVFLRAAEIVSTRISRQQGV